MENEKSENAIKVYLTVWTIFLTIVLVLQSQFVREFASVVVDTLERTNARIDRFHALERPERF